MELAKVTSKGQITIPAEIRRKLHLKPGDKVLFIEEDDRVTVLNSSLAALTNIQRKMSNAASREKLPDEQSAVDLVRAVRKTRKRK
jgi:AbrB family looped-hinge helix DNA binding protein